MKKIAIISSYNESCGNASFTDILINSIRKEGYKVDAIGLNLNLTMSINKQIRKKADLHIDDICKRLREYDGVNLQLEAGLYGTLPNDIIQRVHRLVLANPNTSVTLHSPRLIPPSSLERNYLKSFLKGKILTAIKEYLLAKKALIHYDINTKIITHLKKQNIPLIVHTLRAKEQINWLFSYNNTLVHPLIFIENNFVPDYTTMNDIKKQYNISDNDVCIGIFGYISEYKGHALAIEALNKLPSNYKLFIFGRSHPHNIQPNKIDSYLQKLQNMILSIDKAKAKAKDDYVRLSERIMFMGEYETNVFTNLAASCDVVWLPYFEVGQDGSGIASICMDISEKVICSNAFSFDELFKLIKYNNVYRFDIGNVFELATKTKQIMNDNHLSKIKNTNFSIKSQAKVYISSLF